MANKPKSHIEEMEAKLAKLKAETADSPAQAKARRFVKPVFLTIAAIFGVVFIALIIDIGNDPKPIANADTSDPLPATNTMDEIESAKWQALQGVSDCQLALRIYNDYQPIFAELHQFVANANNQTYQEIYHWKEATRLDARVAELDAKYPSSYTVSMNNTLFAKNLGFAIGQYWRDAHSSMRRTNNQGPIDTEQPSLMNDDLQLLKQNCPNEFKEK
ncbi:hypothetical protein [Shewanella scandinavica]|uniref:hypothetical protein n=1 Tax=Shewanella scandinavica TaxID=3063538 RepID=UPI00318F908E